MRACACSSTSIPVRGSARERSPCRRTPTSIRSPSRPSWRNSPRRGPSSCWRGPTSSADVPSEACVRWRPPAGSASSTPGAPRGSSIGAAGITGRPSACRSWTSSSVGSPVPTSCWRWAWTRQEAPERLWSRFPHRRVTPELLGPLAERWGVPGPFPDMPPLRERLAAVTQAGWAATASPLMPSLVTRHYAEVFGHGGLVAADPGTAGFWVARTFATTRLGTAFVPGQPVRGWAAACVLVARLSVALATWAGRRRRTPRRVHPGRAGARAGDSASRSRSRRGRLTANASARTPISPGSRPWRAGGQTSSAWPPTTTSWPR